MSRSDYQGRLQKAAFDLALKIRSNFLERMIKAIFQVKETFWQKCEGKKLQIVWGE